MLVSTSNGSVNLLVRLLPGMILLWWLFLGVVFIIADDRKTPLSRIFGRLFPGALLLNVLLAEYALRMPPEPATVFWPFMWAGVAMLAVLWLYTVRLQRNYSYFLSLVASILVCVPPFVTIQSARLASKQLDRVNTVEPSSACEPDNTLFVHLSDLHITAGEPRTFEGGTPGDAKFSKLLQKAFAAKPAYLFVSGDIADRGKRSQWNVFMRSLEHMRQSTTVVAAPGNHDLNPVFSNLDSTTSSTWGQEGQFLKYQTELLPTIQTSSGFAAAAIVNQAPARPDEAQLEVASRKYFDCRSQCESGLAMNDPGGGSFNVQFCRVQCEREPEFAVLRQEQKWNDYWANHRDELFPLSFIDSQHFLEIIVLSSAENSIAQLGTNAIGRLSEAQLAALQRLADHIPPHIRTVVFLSHHPITVVEGENPPFRAYLTLFENPDGTTFADAFLRHNVA